MKMVAFRFWSGFRMITSCVHHITKWTKMDRNIVCLGPGHRRAPGLAVAALGELSPALLLALCVLNSLGDSPSLPVLRILTALLGDIMIFLTRDILISCLLLLATVLDRFLVHLWELIDLSTVSSMFLHCCWVTLRQLFLLNHLSHSWGTLQETELSTAEDAKLEVAQAKRRQEEVAGLINIVCSFHWGILRRIFLKQDDDLLRQSLQISSPPPPQKCLKVLER